MPITALETALYGTLSANANLISELGGTYIYNKQAPQSPNSKYVIFQQQGGGDVNDTPIRERNVLYSIFGVATTQEAAAAIDTDIDAALHLATLTISGWSNIWTSRETDVNFTEIDGGGGYSLSGGGHLPRSYGLFWIGVNYDECNRNDREWFIHHFRRDSIKYEFQDGFR